MADRDGPVLIEIDEDGPSPAEAPPITDAGEVPTGQAMQTMAALAARRPSTLARWFWRLLISLIVFFATVALWEWTTALLQRNAALGVAAVLLLATFVVVCLAIVVKEWAALARLARIDEIHADAAKALDQDDRALAQAVTDRLDRLYSGREDTRWGRDRLKQQSADVFDADALLMLAEDTLLVPLDARARREVEAAARQVATVTAIVPLAFADVFAALTSNVRMIRRVAEVYGGRGGTLGAWRLTRAVLTHLVATGAVAVGDDLLGSIGGGHLLARVSRRFGEGVVNGALTARVGIAAMEVCRPLPFSDGKRPSVTGVVRRALTGLFGDKDDATG